MGIESSECDGYRWMLHIVRLLGTIAVPKRVLKQCFQEHGLKKRVLQHVFTGQFCVEKS